MNHSRRYSLPLWVGVLCAILVTAAFVYVYRTTPWEPPWNNIFLNALYPLGAAASAVIGTLICRWFDPSDHPRVTWYYFALGLWMWTGAELIWFSYILIRGDVPLVSISDVLWAAGYFFFWAAILHQYDTVGRLTARRKAQLVGSLILGLFALSLAGNVILRRVTHSEELWLGTFLNVFYPLADLSVGIAALIVARTFGEGLWARPWLALLTFVVADSLYTGLVLTGLYDISAEAGSVLSLLADTLYLDAYLTVALVELAHLLSLTRRSNAARQRAV